MSTDRLPEHCAVCLKKFATAFGSHTGTRCKNCGNYVCSGSKSVCVGWWSDYYGVWYFLDDCPREPGGESHGEWPGYEYRCAHCAEDN